MHRVYIPLYIPYVRVIFALFDNRSRVNMCTTYKRMSTAAPLSFLLNNLFRSLSFGFCAFISQGIYQRHAPVLLTMARGVWELRESFGPKESNRRAKHRFGDFYDFERVRIPL